MGMSAQEDALCDDSLAASCLHSAAAAALQDFREGSIPTLPGNAVTKPVFLKDES